MKQLLNSTKYLLLVIIVSITISSCNSDKTKETIATINYDYSGCFSSGKSKLVNYKSDTTIMASLESGHQLPVNAKLNIQQMDTFNLFIQEIKNLHNEGFCTTVSHYSVNLKTESFNRTDNSCQWNGFEKLTECLFKNRYYPVSLQ